jgi:hypothetical protein
MEPSEFADEMRKLRERFPMTCIKAWTPDDFHSTANGPDDRGQRGLADWKDPSHTKTARALESILSENSGQEWLMIRRAMTRRD